MRDILYAFRTFRRAPLAAITIVATVGLGLGLVAVVFTFYSAFFLRVDAVPNPAELFAADRPVRAGASAWIPFTRLEYEALRRETDAFTDAAAMLRGVPARVDGRPVAGTLVTGNFFQMAGARPALGRILMPDDDQPSAARPVVVLSHKGWTRLLDRDPAAVGRTLSINGKPYEIVGVMRAEFRGLSVGSPDYWAPFGRVAEFRPAYAGRVDDVPIDTLVGRLRPGVSKSAAEAALGVWASRQPKAEGRAAVVRLRPCNGTPMADAGEVLLVFTPIFFAFGLVLMIGCANVANLLLARGVTRQREIGVRLSLGASRRRIVRQLLTESLLLALAAAACGFGVSRLLLTGALNSATATMPPEIAERITLTVPQADWRVPVFLLAGAVVSTVFFALLPALQATRVELVRAMRGEVVRDARPGRARDFLIGVQAGASALLLICAAVFLRSAVAASSADPGVRTSDTVMIPIANEPLRAASVQSIAAHPSVAAVAASSAAAPAMLTAGGGTSGGAAVDYKFVSPEYFDVLGIDLLRGRTFTPAERSAQAGAVIVSESIARRHWPGGDALEQVVRIEGRGTSTVRALTVVGVARDVGGDMPFINFFNYRGLYLPTGPDRPGTSLIARVHGDPEVARRALLDTLTRVDPGFGEIATLRTMAGLGAYFLGIGFWVTVVVGGLALVLTLSGLFSVLSYLVEQRAKELGVRMALGAKTRDVAGLVLLQTARPVVVGLAAGTVLAAALAMVLRATPLASATSGFVNVLDPIAYAGSLFLIVTACALAASIPALRAARIDPIAMLREE
jgi:putative ABC transport system permease protein